MAKKIIKSLPIEANTFSATRTHHSRELAEDYTELISKLITTKGAARIVDIAKSLGVSHVTALRTVRRLQEGGLVVAEPNNPVLLTAKGQKLAQLVRERHQTLVDFLIFIGVPPAVAQIDAEGAEHHISEVTLKKMVEFMKGRGAE